MTNVELLFEHRILMEHARIQGFNYHDYRQLLKSRDISLEQAIEDAKEKAKVLSRDLGVRLGRVASFSESGNYYPYYATANLYKAEDATQSSAPLPELPKGENTISSDVTITYEIR